MSGKGIPEPGLIYCAYRCVVEKKNHTSVSDLRGLGGHLTFFARRAFAVFTFAVVPAGAGAT